MCVCVCSVRYDIGLLKVFSLKSNETNLLSLWFSIRFDSMRVEYTHLTGTHLFQKVKQQQNSNSNEHFKLLQVIIWLNARILIKNS